MTRHVAGPEAHGPIEVLPDLDALDSEARFEALAEEMGMDPWGRIR